MPTSFHNLPIPAGFQAALNTNFPTTQDTSLPAAQMIDHAEASSDSNSVHAYPLRSGYTNLQRFLAFMNCLNCFDYSEGTSVWEQIALHSNTHPLGVENEYGVARTSLTLHQAVQAWYDTLDASRQAAWEKIHQEVQGAAFTDAPFWTFLDSLKGSEEYPDKDTEEADAMRIVFRKRVTDLLDAIQENKELRSKCFMIADDAVETCHDKVALGFEDMELEHLQMRAAQGEFGQQELFRLGGSYFKLAVLDALAIEKAYQSGNADEAVEVKLAYRTKLADALDLPTKTRAMRYDESAKITDDDLAVAQENVRMATEDNDRLVNFLANWSPWQKDLERHYRPDQFKYSRADLEAEQERIQQEVADLNDKKKNPDLKEWERKEKSDALMEEFHNLENTLFGDDWKRLTQEFMAGRLSASSETA